MTDLPYRLGPAPGYDEYKVTSLLRDYLATLMEQPGNEERISQVLTLINTYKDQLGQLRAKNKIGTVKEVYKAIDGFFNAAPAENKKAITCKEGCTACCFIDLDITSDEAATIAGYCRQNEIEIDRDYLMQQAAVGRKSYSALSRCVFLKDNLCRIYPVRPVGCRKHWVKTDPSLCDFSHNKINQVGNYFDINAEILASALLNADEYGSFETMMLKELDNAPAE